MFDLFTIENLFTLLMLTLLQAVLGFDNLLYISLESNRVSKDRQQYVRKVGISLAIIFRIVLLYVIFNAIRYFQDPIFSIHWTKIFIGEFNVHSLIVLLGGGFIIYTAMKEIYHLLSVHDLNENKSKSNKTRSVKAAIFWIIVMNLVFSFDSILSALALTDEFYVMAAAVVISGLLMIWLADRVATFLEKNRMYEVLGLFILFIVGIMLVTEGGHLAHIKFFNYPVEPMTKTTFYFVLVVLILVDIVQSKYQAKLTKQIQRNE